jgi:hypothetical protein
MGTFVAGSYWIKIYHLRKKKPSIQLRGHYKSDYKLTFSPWREEVYTRVWGTKSGLQAVKRTWIRELVPHWCSCKASDRAWYAHINQGSCDIWLLPCRCKLLCKRKTKYIRTESGHVCLTCQQSDGHSKWQESGQVELHLQWENKDIKYKGSVHDTDPDNTASTRIQTPSLN